EHSMRILILLASCLLAATALAQQEKHLLYMTTPDAAQPGGSGEGLLLFDIDNGHRFVRRIDVPSFKEGVRGISACAATASLYGSRAYLASTTTLDVVDTKTHAIVKSISPIGESGVFPFTVNGAGTRAYVCLGQTVGFDVADLTTGRLLTRVLAGGSAMKR